MGIDIENRTVRSAKRTKPKSRNTQKQLLAELYYFLAKRTESAANKTIHKWLCQSKTVAPAVSLGRIIRESENPDKALFIVVGKVLDDERVPLKKKLTVAAISFSKSARAKICGAGGEAITIDQFAQRYPLATDAHLIRGSGERRKSTKYFGDPSSKTNPCLPRTISRGRNFEKRLKKR